MQNEKWAVFARDDQCYVRVSVPMSKGRAEEIVEEWVEVVDKEGWLDELLPLEVKQYNGR